MRAFRAKCNVSISTPVTSPTPSVSGLSGVMTLPPSTSIGHDLQSRLWGVIYHGIGAVLHPPICQVLYQAICHDQMSYHQAMYVRCYTIGYRYFHQVNHRSRPQSHQAPESNPPVWVVHKKTIHNFTPGSVIMCFPFLTPLLLIED